jgi:hypothetical protein
LEAAADFIPEESGRMERDDFVSEWKPNEKLNRWRKKYALVCVSLFFKKHFFLLAKLEDGQKDKSPKRDEYHQVAMPSNFDNDKRIGSADDRAYTSKGGKQRL